MTGEAPFSRAALAMRRRGARRAGGKWPTSICSPAPTGRGEAIFAEHEAILVAQCQQLRFSEAVKAVEYWCQRADADACEDDAERRREGAHLHVSATIDGTVVISGVLDPVSGTIVTASSNAWSTSCTWRINAAG